jgi:hypothetical protein
MRTPCRAVRRACFALVLLTASFVLMLPGAPAAQAASVAQNNGCLGVTGTFSQFAVPITGTASPNPVTVPNTVTLSSTSVSIGVDSTLIGAGVPTGLVSAAPSLADIGTDQSGSGGGLNAGVDAVTVAAGSVKLKISGTNTVEGVQTAQNASPVNLTFYVVLDPVTLAISAYTGISSPPSATPDPARTGTLLVGNLPVTVGVSDTVWTATGGPIVLAEQNVAPANLLNPGAADQAAAPLQLTPRINGHINAPFHCWPGTVNPPPAANQPLIPGAPVALQTIAVQGGGLPSSTTSTTPATTTPTSTSTTTTAPATTVPPTTVKTATAVTGTGTYAATCSNSLTPDKSTLSFAVTGTAPSDVEAGKTVTLSKQSWTVGVPGPLLDTGINLGLLAPGQLVDGTVTAAVFASNTKEGTVVAAPAPVQFGPIEVDPVTGLAKDGKATFAVADMTWTAVGGDVAYVMAPTKVQVAIGTIKVDFACAPADASVHIVTTTVTGKTDIPAATQVEGEVVTQPAAGQPVAGEPLARTGAPELLRNVVLALILLDLGYLLVTAARAPRRRANR